MITNNKLSLQIDILQCSLQLARDLTRLQPADTKDKAGCIEHLLDVIDTCADDLRKALKPEGRSLEITCPSHPFVFCPKSQKNEAVHFCLYCQHFSSVSKLPPQLICLYD